jgi:hypothetical protein
VQRHRVGPDDRPPLRHRPVAVHRNLDLSMMPGYELFSCHRLLPSFLILIAGFATL